MESMDLNAAWIFVRVVQTGSITATSQLLSIPKSTISLKLKQLEERLGVALLKRTTRKLSLTEVGETYFRTCARSIQELREAEGTLSDNKERVRGLLRVSAPVELGSTILANLFSGFVKLFPDLELDIHVSDRVVDLISENFDLAIRIGELEDSSLVARRIGQTGLQLYASPSYLKKAAIPRTPLDLKEHQCIRFTALATPNIWRMEKGAQKVRVPVRGAITANNLYTIKEVTLAGHGIALLPTFLCTGEVKKGRLVPVLSGWNSEQSRIHAVYPAHQFVPQKVKVFVEYLANKFEDEVY